MTTASGRWRFGGAADPLQDPFVFGFAVLGADSVAAAVRSPLDADAGRFYQFRSGDTIVVHLPGGSSVRAVSVNAIPRFRSVQLVAAVMWIEAESFGLARVAYRLAKRLDTEFGLQLRRAEGPNFGLAVKLDGGSMAWDSTTTPTQGRLGRLLNGAINNLLPQKEMDVTTVVADYTLREQRYWLPLRVKWAGYLGTPDDAGTEDAPRVMEPISYEWTFDIEDVRERGASASPGNPATAAEALVQWRAAGDSISGDLASAGPEQVITILPRDQGRLAESDLLPAPIWDESIGGLDDRSMEEIASMLGGIGTAEDDGMADPGPCPCHFEPPFWTLRLMRYNAKEGLSVGTRAWQDMGWGRAIATVRFRTAYRYPDVSVTVQHDHPRRRLQASVYASVLPFDSVSACSVAHRRFRHDSHDALQLDNRCRASAAPREGRAQLGLCSRFRGTSHDLRRGQHWHSNRRLCSLDALVGRPGGAFSPRRRRGRRPGIVGCQPHRQGFGDRGVDHPPGGWLVVRAGSWRRADLGRSGGP